MTEQAIETPLFSISKRQNKHFSKTPILLSILVFFFLLFRKLIFSVLLISIQITQMLPTLCITVDPLHNYQHHQFHVSCMNNLLGLTASRDLDKALTSMGLCGANAKAKDPCDWNGVQCAEKVITEIHWTERLDVQIANIAWLPSTLVVLETSLVDIGSELDTRMLPESLTDCDMANCGLYGPLELRTLPPKMRMLRLPDNEFSGTVRLTDLPKHFKGLYLRKNPLKAVVVRNKDLPGSFMFARFYNPAKRVKFICLDAKKADRRVYISEYDSIRSYSLSSGSTESGAYPTESGSECSLDSHSNRYCDSWGLKM